MYIQIQGQMGMCEDNWCDFIFILLNHLYVNVSILTKKFLMKCDRFFEKYISVDYLFIFNSVDKYLFM
jgi:hypothetical protein